MRGKNTLNLTLFLFSSQHSVAPGDQRLQQSRRILLHQWHSGHPPLQWREEKTRRRWGRRCRFCFPPFQFPLSLCTHFSCVWRRWRFWRRGGRACFCHLLWLVMLYAGQGENRDSISFSTPPVLPHTHGAASQFYRTLRCAADIPYSCHTTLIPAGKVSLLLPAFIFTTQQKAAKQALTITHLFHIDWSQLVIFFLYFQTECS